MLGPLMAGIMMETAQADIRLPRLPYNIAQGIIGCMVANVLTPTILHSFLQQWPVFLGIVLIIIIFNTGLGWVLSRLRILPGTTAIWGLLPGAASAMMLMAEGYGADSRLVGFMQYLRVVMVAVIASMIARFWVHTTAAPPPVIWFPALHWLPFVETLAIIGGGVTIGYFSKLPAGMLLVTLFAATVLHLTGLVDLELPRWLLAMGYLGIGWQTGLRFTREILAYAMRALPKIFLSILAGIAFCGGLSLLVTKFLGMDPLTAYLATSPGGADGVAIIAASSNVNVGFIMALQIFRVFMVIFIGPAISRFASNKIGTSTKEIKNET